MTCEDHGYLREVTVFPTNDKRPRDLDMVNQVAAVLDGVSLKFPLDVFNNTHFQAYTKHLDKEHCTPHRLSASESFRSLLMELS